MCSRNRGAGTGLESLACVGCCATLSDVAQWATALQSATEGSVNQRSSSPGLTVASDLELVTGCGLSDLRGVVDVWEIVR